MSGLRVEENVVDAMRLHPLDKELVSDGVLAVELIVLDDLVELLDPLDAALEEARLEADQGDLKLQCLGLLLALLLLEESLAKVVNTLDNSVNAFFSDVSEALLGGLTELATAKLNELRPVLLHELLVIDQEGNTDVLNEDTEDVHVHGAGGVSEAFLVDLILILREQVEDGGEAIGITEDIDQPHKKIRVALSQTRHNEYTLSFDIGLDKVVTAVVQVDLVSGPELLRLGHVHLDSWRIDTDLLVELVGPALVLLSLFIGLGTVVLIDSESDQSHLYCSVWGHNLLCELEDGRLVPKSLIVTINEGALYQGRSPGERFFRLGLKRSELDRPSVEVLVGSLDIMNELQVEHVTIDLVDSGLGPAVNLRNRVIQNGVYHVALFQVTFPLLVGGM